MGHRSFFSNNIKKATVGFSRIRTCWPLDHHHRRKNWINSTDMLQEFFCLPFYADPVVYIPALNRSESFIIWEERLREKLVLLVSR